eukprot:scaffold32205_cov65-Phaeocystis_antarctica.AAC.2
MPNMFVTLDVSKLNSGWLKGNTPCRVERRAYYDAGRGVGREAGGGGGASGVHGEGPTQGWTSGHARSAP